MKNKIVPSILTDSPTALNKLNRYRCDNTPEDLQNRLRTYRCPRRGIQRTSSRRLDPRRKRNWPGKLIDRARAASRTVNPSLQEKQNRASLRIPALSKVMLRGNFSLTRLSGLDAAESADRAIEPGGVLGVLGRQANWHDILAKRDTAALK